MELNINKGELATVLIFAEVGIIKARKRQDQWGGFEKDFLDETMKKIEELRKKAYED